MTSIPMPRLFLAALSLATSPSCLCVSDFPDLPSDDTVGTASTQSDPSGDVPAAPIARDDFYVLLQTDDTPYRVAGPEGLLANDSAPASTASAASSSTAQGWSFTVEADGGFEYARASFFWGVDGFRYTAFDDAASSAEAHFVVRPVAVELSDVSQGFGGITLSGGSVGDQSGTSVAGIGDFNGDGFDDLVVGAPTHSSGGAVTGRCHVVLGSASPIGVSLGTLAEDGTGFVIDGEASGDRACHSAAALGDVDGDGLDDFAIGAPGAGPTRNGRAYVIFGRNGLGSIDLDDVENGLGDGFSIEGEAANDELGWSVALAGNINGDGHPDIVVGARSGHDPVGVTGRAYVVLGKADTDPVDLAELASGVGGFAILGEADGDQAGSAAFGGVDVNGDGLDDIVVGAPGADVPGSDTGRAYAVFGKPDTALVRLEDVAGGTGGFAIAGASMGDHAGISVGAIADANGDGRDELIVGIERDSAEYGRVYVVFGKSDGDVVGLADVEDGQYGYSLRATDLGDLAGSVVAEAGDFDGDGIGDLAVAAPLADSAAAEDVGSIYVLYGTDTMESATLGDMVNGTKGFVVVGEAANDVAGIAISGAGDFNGDGLDDLLIGAPGSGTPGKAYVLFGVPSQLM